VGVAEPNPVVRRPVALIIMDGLAYGASADTADNAIARANTPNLDHLWATYPHMLLGASGADVGLPDGQMGNSEVGHLNIGAGRVVYQDITRIDRAIEDGSFFDNDVLCAAIDVAVNRASEAGEQNGQGTVHLMGLISDGGVHASLNHLYALLELAQQRGALDVVIHCFMDGRDVPPRSAVGYLRELEARCKEIGLGRIATVTGRYFAMDRDGRWDRVQRAYEALTIGAGRQEPSAIEACEASYARGTTDEFIEPTVIDGDFTPIAEGDTVIFFNFRPDRARELSHALTDTTFTGFDRVAHPHTHFVCMTPYDDTLDAPIAFPKEPLADTLAEVLSTHGLRQMHVAETEKYAHVTFFLNGGREKPFPGEERILIPSPPVATYDLQPEMSAPEIGDALVESITHDAADVYLCNFANGDMVGHTGIFDASVKAVEAVDLQIGRIVEAMQERGGAVLITADHGNVEQMVDHDGTPVTAHTLNPVPLVAIDTGAGTLKPGTLSDIAPTVLALCGIEIPHAWTGRNLLIY